MWKVYKHVREDPEERLQQGGFLYQRGMDIYRVKYKGMIKGVRSNNIRKIN